MTKRNEILFVKVPGVNGLGNTSGTEKAPEELMLDFFDFLVEEIKINREDIREQEESIISGAERLFTSDKKLIFVGGDHSISYPLVRAFAESGRGEGNGKERVLIVFDAHADTMPSMKEPSHEEWLRALIESGFPAESVMLIGARKIEKVEEEFLDRHGIKRISVSDVRDSQVEIRDLIEEFVFEKEVYISFDIDVFDSEIVKATGYPEEDGLKVDEVISLIGDICELGEVRAVDLVEVNPLKEDFAETRKIAIGILTKFVNC